MAFTIHPDVSSPLIRLEIVSASLLSLFIIALDKFRKIILNYG